MMYFSNILIFLQFLHIESNKQLLVESKIFNFIEARTNLFTYALQEM